MSHHGESALSETIIKTEGIRKDYVLGAEVVHAREDLDTHVYYAFWEDVAPYDEGPQIAHIHTSLITHTHTDTHTHALTDTTVRTILMATCQ